MPPPTVTPELLWQLRHDVLYPRSPDDHSPQAKLTDMPSGVQAEMWAIALLVSSVHAPSSGRRAPAPPAPPPGMTREETERIKILVSALAKGPR